MDIPFFASVPNMQFKLNFQGRFQKLDLKKPQSIRAVFEAVANSFDATTFLGDQGKIVVRILSRPTRNLQTGTDEQEYELAGYEIEDNGEGFRAIAPLFAHSVGIMA